MTPRTHTHISDDSEIPSLCKKTFVSISRAVTVVWVVAIVLILPASVCSIRWSIAVGAEQAEQNNEIKALQETQNDIRAIKADISELVKRSRERRQ